MVKNKSLLMLFVVLIGFQKSFADNCAPENWEVPGANLARCDFRRVDFKAESIKRHQQFIVFSSGPRRSMSGSGSVNFSNANFEGNKTLGYVEFVGSVHFYNTNFNQADFRGNGQRFQGPTFWRGTQLRSANFSGVGLNDVSFSDAALTGAILDKVTLNWVYFYEGKNILHGAQLTNIIASNVLFNSAEMHQARISGVCKECSFKNTKLDGANLSNTDFRGPQGANFTDANLPMVKFHQVNLTHANFSKAKLPEAEFNKAILNQAGFQHATVYKANFTEASLVSTNFKSVVFDPGVKYARANFTQAVFDGGTCMKRGTAAIGGCSPLIPYQRQ